MRRLILALCLAFASISAQAAIVVLCTTDPGAGHDCPSYVWRDTASLTSADQLYYYAATSGNPQGAASLIYFPVQSYTGSLILFVCTSGGTNGGSCTGAASWQTVAVTAPAQPPTNTGGGSGCVPSARTIAPCPTGFAPTSVTPEAGNTAGAYPGVFDQIPQQDVTVACCFLVVLLMGMTFGIWRP